MLDRNAILAAQDIKIEKVSVPEWGGDVCIRTFDGATRSRITEHAIKTEKIGYRGLMPLIVACGICDEKGTAVFTEADAEELQKKNSVVLERLGEAISNLNEMGKGAAAKAKEKFQDGQGT